MNERLKELRKFLRLTQEEFSKKIGIKRNTLANYEIGRNEPIDAVFFSICSVFNVNENWLRFGEGEMFTETDETLLTQLKKKYDLSGFAYKLIEVFVKLPSDSQKIIEDYILEAAEQYSINNENYIDKEVESYRAELVSEQKGEMSVALDDIEERKA